jgi:RHS repeat-associated protein
VSPGNKTFYMLNDNKGSLTVVTNSSGQVIENTSYSPYGSILTGGTKTRYQYEAKEYDSVVGDIDFHARKYKADWGIFTQPDTLIQNVYNPQNLNRYSFEGNNPYNRVDPSGHIAIVALIIAYYAIAATVTLVSTGIVAYDSYKHPEHRDQNIKELASTAVFAGATIPLDPTGTLALTITAVGTLLSAKGVIDRLETEEEKEDKKESFVIIKKIDTTDPNARVVTYQNVPSSDLKSYQAGLVSSGWTPVLDKNGKVDYYCTGTGCPGNNGNKEKPKSDTTKKNINSGK